MATRQIICLDDVIEAVVPHIQLVLRDATVSVHFLFLLVSESGVIASQRELKNLVVGIATFWKGKPDSQNVFEFYKDNSN